MNLKGSLPHLLSVLFFLILSLAYFFPILEGKEIVQHDIAQWEGMSKEIQDFREEYGSEPLWTRSMFGGMPAYQISVLYGSNLMKYVDKAISLGLPTPVNYVFLALLGFYLLLISLRVDFRLAIAGAISFAFASYNIIIIMAGHNSKMHALAYVPFVIAGVLYVFRGRLFFGGVLTGMFLSLEIYANHLQITYYLALLILILVITEVISALRSGALQGIVKKGLVLMVAVILSVLPNITSLWATYEYGKFSTRGPSELTDKSVSSGLDKDYALGWSYGVKETMTLLIPDFMGGPTQSELSRNSATYKALVANGAGAQANQFIKQVPLYWGDQPFTSGPNYNGAIIMFLFVFSLFVAKGNLKYWIVSATLLFAMLSWGKNFLPLTDLFFNYFPAYNKFRAVSMILALLSFTLPFLAFTGLRQAMEGKSKDIKKNLQWSYYITGGVALIFVLLPSVSGGFAGPVDASLSSYPDWLLDAIREDRASGLQLDALRSFLLITAAAVVSYLYFISNKINLKVFAMSLSLLVLFDMWGVDKRYLSSDDFSKKSEQTFQPTSADQEILQDPELGYRVMNVSVSTFNDASTSYFHHSVGGYHGAKLKRYQELIEYQISKNNMAVLDMLNTKYFILPRQDGNGLEVQVNPGALGAAWFVDEYKFVKDADEEILALTDFEPATMAIIDKRFEGMIDKKFSNRDTLADIQLVSYKPNELVYEVTSATEQLAVFSEIYYDRGWHAYLDGVPLRHFRVNYVLRGAVVPSGEHMIEFRFEPEVFSTGEPIALGGSIILILVFTAGVFIELKHSKE
jgi:hypothetical protein